MPALVIEHSFSSFSLTNEAIASLLNPKISISAEETSQISCRTSNVWNSSFGVESGTKCRHRFGEPANFYHCRWDFTDRWFVSSLRSFCRLHVQRSPSGTDRCNSTAACFFFFFYKNSRGSGCGADTGTNCWAFWSTDTVAALADACTVSSPALAVQQIIAEETVVCIPNRSTFRAFRSLCVSLRLLARLYTAIHQSPAQTHLHASQAPWPDSFRFCLCQNMCRTRAWHCHRIHAYSTVVAEPGCIPGLFSWASYLLSTSWSTTDMRIWNPSQSRWVFRNGTAIPVAGVTTNKKFVCTRQAKTSKSTGQLQRDWLEASEEQHDELVLRWPTKSYCPQRVTSLTTWSARLTETAEALKPWWPGLKQSLDSNDHKRRVRVSRCSLSRTSSRGNEENASLTTSPGLSRTMT